MKTEISNLTSDLHQRLLIVITAGVVNVISNLGLSGSA